MESCLLSNQIIHDEFVSLLLDNTLSNHFEATAFELHKLFSELTSLDGNRIEPIVQIYWNIPQRNKNNLLIANHNLMAVIEGK